MSPLTQSAGFHNFILYGDVADMPPWVVYAFGALSLLMVVFVLVAFSPSFNGRDTLKLVAIICSVLAIVGLIAVVAIAYYWKRRPKQVANLAHVIFPNSSTERETAQRNPSS